MTAMPRVWSVSALLKAVADALQSRLGACTVQGELVSLVRAGSGHCYFTLKDQAGTAGIRCVMFRSAAAALADGQLAEGALVEARGRLAIYEPRGDLQLIVESLRGAGPGALYEEFLRRKARLQAEGLFDTERKRSLPPRPWTVGVVTSPSGAVVHDVCTTLARRAPHVRLIIFPVPVQGRDAPPAIVEALELANRRGEVDVLIVCRGGGSIEDLWAYNDESVVRAVGRSRIPVISAVGHETDVTLCDLVADLRAPTPTAAAELVCASLAESLAELATRHARATQALDDRLARDAQRLDRAAWRLGRPVLAFRTEAVRLQASFAQLSAALHRHLTRETGRCDGQHGQLQAAMSAALNRARQRLDLLQARRAGLDPQGVLDRGYAWIQADDGSTVCSVAQVRRGQTVMVRLKDGQFESEVRHVTMALRSSA